MSSLTQRVAKLNIGNTFGALLIGLIFAAVLFGISNAQVFVYFRNRRKSRLMHYALPVIWLWVLDALHLAVTSHCVYHYLVTDFSNFIGLTEVVWSFKVHVLLNSIINMSVHVLYLHRIWKASRAHSRAIPIVVGMVMAVGLAFSIDINWSARKVHLFADFASQIQWMTYASLAIVFLVDLLIASSLCYIIASSRTGFSSIDGFTSKLMSFVINTGALTSLCSLTGLITFAAMPRNFIFLSIQIVFPKLYVNSFLALLNARYYTKNIGHYTQGIGYYTMDPSHIEDPQQQRRPFKFRPIESTLMDNRCTFPDDDVLFPARPAQTLTHPHRGIAVEVQMVTLSD